MLSFDKTRLMMNGSIRLTRLVARPVILILKLETDDAAVRLVVGEAVGVAAAARI